MLALPEELSLLELLFLCSLDTLVKLIIEKIHCTVSVSNKTMAFAIRAGLVGLLALIPAIAAVLRSGVEVRTF